MTFSAADHEAMSRALLLAAHGLHTTTPNPRVGCVLMRDGRIVGEGWHQRAGSAHAESRRCTWPGTQLAARPPMSLWSRVRITGARRPAPMHSSTRESSAWWPRWTIRTRWSRAGACNACGPAGSSPTTGLLEAQARELNIGFISRMTRGRPWVRLKTAGTLDGKSALNNGVSQWITGAAARRDGHRWRARACAILTGIGTVRDDDPRLTVRDIPCERQPLRVLVDSRLEVTPAAAMLEGGNCLIATAIHDPPRPRHSRPSGRKS
jgi:diaminohydroxyphosphoribosylaminopyrimidine deaminase / 5-amino-6-(5-phosphoribosylamino)uracil reductase